MRRKSGAINAAASTKANCNYDSGNLRARSLRGPYRVVLRQRRSQVVPLAEPLSELIGKLSPFLRIANTTSGRANRPHPSPMRPAVNRHSKSSFRTVRMTRQVEFNHFGKLRRRLELLLQRFTFACLSDRAGRWRTFTDWRIWRDSRRYLGLCHIIRFRL